jgi:replicative DNA helicase
MIRLSWTRGYTDEEVADRLLATMAFLPDCRDMIVTNLGQWGYFPQPQQQSAWEIMHAEHLDQNPFASEDVVHALAGLEYTDAGTWLFGLEWEKYVGKQSILEACQRVVRAAKQRSFTQIVNEKLKEAADLGQDVGVCAAALAHSLEEIDKVPSVGFKNMNDAIDSIIRDMERPADKNRIVRTPIPDLNRVIEGFHPSDYVVVGGSTSSGKTSFAIACASHYAESGGTVLYYVLDHKAEDMARRLATAHSGKNRRDLTVADMKRLRDEHRLMIGNFLYEVPETSNMTEFRLVCQKAVRQNGVGLIILDHIGQAQTSAKRNAYELVTEVSREIKQIGIRLDVPMLILCQLSRSYEHGEVRPEKDQYPRPRMSHLRDSGAIEQDANVVILIHNKLKLIESREGTESAAYRKYVTDCVVNGSTPVEIIVAKNKDGQTQTIKYYFHSPTMTYVAGVETKRTGEDYYDRN